MPQSQSKWLPVPVHFGATLVSSPPSWVQGDQGQCGCGQWWPWGWHQPGNLCALSRGLSGQGASATSRAPCSSCCSGDSDVRPCSDVPIPHCLAGGSAGASVPPLGVLRTGFGLSPFGKGLGCHYVRSQQCPPVSTQLASGAVGPAIRAATPPRSCPACRNPPFLCTPPAPLFVPACQRDLDLPLRVLLLPHPQPVLAPFRCNTNHPVPAGYREPQNPPHFFWGSIACTPNYLRPWGRGAAWGSQWQWGLGESGTTLGQIHLSLLYLSQAWAEGPLQCPQ